MTTNIFQQWKEQKEHLKALYEKAASFGWISPQRKQEVLQKLDSDLLTIGVIGQMKSGKSTFLNAWVFEEEILPSGTPPTTAALTLIKYGSEKKLLAEFYSPEEWKAQQLLAAQDLSQGNLSDEEKSRIQAAQELLQGARPLGNRLSSLLGTQQEDSLDQLFQYASAGGKYACITKSITLYSPKDYLKGVEIVDTPGFNDPVVSREERTRAFLAKADTVILLLPANQLGSQNDQDLIFKTCAASGIQHLLIGINKYDLPYTDPQKPQMPEELETYVAQMLQNTCREYNCSEQDLLFAKPKAFSAEMALYAKLPDDLLLHDAVKKQTWERYCENFGVPKQREQEMMKWSRMDEFTKEVLALIQKEKGRILLEKPAAWLAALYNSKIQELDTKLLLAKTQVNNLQQPNEELEERKSNLQRAQRRFERKVQTLELDLEEDLSTLIQKGKRQLEDAMTDTCNQAIRSIESASWATSAKSLRIHINGSLQYLTKTTLRRLVEDLGDEAKNLLLRDVNNFLGEIETILLPCLDFTEDQMDKKDLLAELKHQIQMNIQNEEIFSFHSFQEQQSTWFKKYSVILIGWRFLGSSSYYLNKFLSEKSKKTQLIEQLYELKASFNPSVYLNTIFAVKSQILQKIQDTLSQELLTPLTTQIDALLSSEQSKQQLLQQTQHEIEALTSQKKTWTEQKQQLAL